MIPGVSGTAALSDGNGGATASLSTPWTPSSAGTYYWVASYAGDATFPGFTTQCGAPSQQLTVALRPTATTYTGAQTVRYLDLLGLDHDLELRDTTTS